IDFYRKELRSRSWQELRVSLAKANAKEGRFLLGFANNAMALFLNIRVEKGLTVVECRPEVRDKPARLAAKDLPKPATLSEGKKVIDLNRFPRLVGARPGQGNSAVLSYDAPGKVADAVAFYRKKLAEQGWTEEPGGSGDDTLATPSFAKAGFLLHFFIGKSDRAGRVNVRIENKGNVDPRMLPRVPDSDEEGIDHFAHVHYGTGATVEAAADFFRKEL